MVEYGLNLLAIREETPACLLVETWKGWFSISRYYGGCKLSWWPAKHLHLPELHPRAWWPRSFHSVHRGPWWTAAGSARWRECSLWACTQLCTPTAGRRTSAPSLQRTEKESWRCLRSVQILGFAICSSVSSEKCGILWSSTVSLLSFWHSFSKIFGKELRYLNKAKE